MLDVSYEVPESGTHPITPSSASTPQARQALTALAATTPGRRRVIQAAAEEYLSQIDRRRLPLGYDLPITLDHSNRADAYRMRRGDVFARMLGIACRPSDAQLPDTARAVLAAINAPVDRLVEQAEVTGQPALVALLHIAGAAPSMSPADVAAHRAASHVRSPRPPSATGTCPRCGGTFETCTCGQRPTVQPVAPAFVSAGEW